MYKSKEFDYDLWTTQEGGIKRYWARVKATGEVAEISIEIMRCLRTEEKRIYREIETSQQRGSMLSLEFLYDEEKEGWLSDCGIGASEMENTLTEEAFRQLLTPAQLSVFDECLIRGESQKAYAAAHGVTFQMVNKHIHAIRKKAKKYFWQWLKKRPEMSVEG